MARNEDGLTLVELLIAMLIVGILTTIALPAFADLRGRSHDAKAKATAHHAQVAIETCGQESPTGYTRCNARALLALDPSLPPSPTLRLSGLGADGYTIAVQSQPTSQIFRIRRRAGVLTFTCSRARVGSCPRGGNWG
jgi:prepilin-type N-terminal cleavage/methylation domain-containing protein